MGLQLLLFLLMVFTMLQFGSFCLDAVLPRMVGMTFRDLAAADEKSPYGLIKAKIIVQGFLSICIFFLPAFLFGYLTHPDLKNYLGLRQPQKPIQVLLAVSVMLGAIPCLILIENLVSMLNFGTAVRQSEEAAQRMQQAYFVMPTFTDFIRTFIIMAIIPAIGEEMFFRGIFLRFAHKRTKNMVFPIIFTAIIFSFAHANVYGFLSIAIAGSLLAFIYYITGSLWCSIAAHMCFNGVQVLLAYLGNSSPAIKSFVQSNSIPSWTVIAGVILAFGAMYLLVQQKTPLAPNWSDDFDTPDELPESSVAKF